MITLFLLTACGSQTVLSERHEEAAEAAVLQRHTGRFMRENTEMDGESVYIHSCEAVPQGGHISVSITNQAGDACLLLNESATLPENGMVTVTVSADELPCMIQTDMTVFTGEFEI